MSEKGYDRAPCFLCFLRISLPSFCVGNKFRLEQKVWPLGAIRTSAYSVLGVTLNLLLLCVFSGFTRILCPEGIGNAVCKWGLKEQWTVCISPPLRACSIVPLTSLIKHTFKDKKHEDFHGTSRISSQVQGP